MLHPILSMQGTTRSPSPSRTTCDGKEPPHIARHSVRRGIKVARSTGSESFSRSKDKALDAPVVFPERAENTALRAVSRS
eukprot:5198841-Pyramimonas_sp.AAC.1